jgi:hypothetical protein
MRRSHRLLARTVTLVIALLAMTRMPVAAETAFANPAFQTQWQQGEAVTPNFWGPLATAHDGQMEPYANAPGGQRLVQYFDKARMELTNPATGTVTNGLLATELVTGQIQVGDSSFQPKPPPAIAVAGDPGTTGATYAALATTASTLLQPAQPMPGIVSFNQVNADGTARSQAITPSDPLKYVAYDDATQHNVPQAFAQFRDKVGLLTIGYAISEPFQTSVMVGGQMRYLTAQLFQRRVLTYTQVNPDPFKAEFGNIGAQYYQWRYGSAPT